jgi:hypothetical protein
MAKRLGVSGAHLSNMLSPTPTRQPGEDFRRKVAAHWGVSYAQLEALATGELLPASSSDPEPPPQLVAALHGYAWTSELPTAVRGVVAEQAKQYFAVLGADMPVSEWQVVLTGLEREALAIAARRGRTPQVRPPAPAAPEAGAKLKDR